MCQDLDLDWQVVVCTGLVVVFHMCNTVTWWRISGNARSCFCYVSRWLLQCTLCRAPKTVTDKLQRVLNAAARVASDTRKFDCGLTTLLHDELHWLDVPERVNYKLGVMIYRCLHGLTPRYLADHLTPASDVASRLRLRSSQTNISLLYLAVDSIHTAVGRFQLPVRRSGIRCRASWEIQRAVLTVLNSFSR